MKNEQLWNREYLLLLGITFCSGMTAQFISTAMTPYLTYGLLVGTAITGVLSSLYTVVSSMGRLFAGNLVDRLSRRPFIFAGFFLFGIGSLGFGCVSALHLLILFRIVQGVGFAVSSAASSAAAADVIPVKRLGAGLGYMSMVNALTQIVGPLLCTVLIGVGYYAMPFYVAAGICVISILVALFTKDVYRMTKKDVSSARCQISIRGLFEKHALAPAGLQFLISFAFSVYMVWGYNITVEKGFDSLELGPLNFAGLFFALAALGMVIARLIVTKYMDRWNEYLTAAPVCLLGAASFLLCCGETTSIRFLTGGILYGICLGIVQPSLNTRALKNVAADRRGAATGTFMLGFDGGIGLGAAAWGLVIAASSYDIMLLFGCGILILAAILSVILWRCAK